MTHQTHTTTNTTSRKGGVPHHLHEWFSLPSTSTSSTTSSTSTPDASQPSPDRVSHRRISISTWTITTSRGAIGNSSYMDTLGDRLSIPPPEMVFPSNTLVLKHEPSGFTYTFSAEEALRCVDGVQEGNRMQGVDLSADWRGSNAQRRHHALGEKPKKKSKGIKVAYADEWGKGRSDEKERMSAQTTAEDPPTTAFGAAAATQIADAREYDWTYSTTWVGGVDAGGGGGASSSSSSSSPTPTFEPGTDPSEDRIPVERLGPSSGEPILFYDDLVLFEDELGDNGSSMLGVKIRVMPSGFLILQRFFLRVDDVVFRLFDVRVYCAFNEGPTAANGNEAPATATARPGVDLGSLSLGPTRREMASATATSTSTPPPRQKLIRECTGCEAPYKDVKAKLPPYKPNDLSLLTDPAWVSQTLQNIVARKQMTTAQQHPAYAGGVGVAPAPAKFPTSGDVPGQASNPPAAAAVLGQVDEDVWEGVGSRVDVVVL